MNKNEVKEILNKTLDPRKLAGEKFCIYKNYILETLESISTYIFNDNFEKIPDFCFESPAGDGYGRDNSVIDFGFDENHKDIIQALNYLSYLKKYCEGNIDTAFVDWEDYIY